MTNIKELLKGLKVSTKKEGFLKIKEQVQDEQAKKFLQYLIEAEEKKASKPKGLTKSQKENIVIKQKLVDMILSLNTELTATEIKNQYNSVYATNYSINKIIALLTQLTKEGKILKEYSQKTAFFNYNPDYEEEA